MRFAKYRDTFFCVLRSMSAVGSGDHSNFFRAIVHDILLLSRPVRTLYLSQLLENSKLAAFEAHLLKNSLVLLM